MFTFSRGCGAALALAAGTLILHGPAQANSFTELHAVDDQTLDEIRGGFSVAYDYGQLRMALSFTRAIMIQEILGPLTGQPATGTGEQTVVSGPPPAAIVQSGMNNTVSPPAIANLSGGVISAVIQNNLDNQAIRNFNTVNITVTSKALSQAFSVQTFAQGAFLRFLR